MSIWDLRIQKRGVPAKMSYLSGHVGAKGFPFLVGETPFHVLIKKSPLGKFNDSGASKFLRESQALAKRTPEDCLV